LLTRDEMLGYTRLASMENKTDTKIITSDDENATSTHWAANDRSPNRMLLVSPNHGTMYRTNTASENMVAKPYPLSNHPNASCENPKKRVTWMIRVDTNAHTAV